MYAGMRPHAPGHQGAGQAVPALTNSHNLPRPWMQCNVKVNDLLATSESYFESSGEAGPQAKGVNHLETPLRQLHVTHRASSCAKRGGHVHLCSKTRGARGIEPETFRRRGQLLSRPPTTGPLCMCNVFLGTAMRRATVSGPQCSFCAGLSWSDVVASTLHLILVVLSCRRHW